MSQFHLRPVAADNPSQSPSSSPTASTTSPDRPSPHKTSPVSVISPFNNNNNNNNNNSNPPTRNRRPLSPSSIRDLDLTRTSDMPQRKYPAPPTGHELMAMFPPAPPETPLETRGGPTSGFFQRQERAFFAQAGKEIFRVRVEIDLPQHAPVVTAADLEAHHGKPRPPMQRSDGQNGGTPGSGGPRSWPPPLPTHPPPNTGHPHHSNHSPVSGVVPNTRPSQRGGVPVSPYPVNSHSPNTSHLHPAQNLHSSPPHQAGSMALRTPPQEAMAAAVTQRPKTEFPLEEFDGDEAWRRPIPYAERRRAGKHTKRVIVR